MAVIEQVGIGSARSPKSSSLTRSTAHPTRGWRDSDAIAIATIPHTTSNLDADGKLERIIRREGARRAPTDAERADASTEMAPYVAHSTPSPGKWC